MSGRRVHEEDRGDHQAVQAGRREGGPDGDRHRRDDRLGGTRLRAVEGPHRALSWRRVHGRLPAEDQGGGGRARSLRGQGGRGGGGGGQDRQHRRRQDLRDPGGGGHPHPHGRARSERTVMRAPTRRDNVRRFTWALATALVLVTAGLATAQTSAPATPAPAVTTPAPAPGTPAPAPPSKIDKGD